MRHSGPTGSGPTASGPTGPTEHVGRVVGALLDAAPLGHDADRRVLLSKHARVLGELHGQVGVRLRRERIGILSLPSGQVLASDPTYASFDVEPFTRRALPGRYPVVVTRIAVGEPGPHDMIAAAALLLRDEAPVRWELALTVDQDLADLGPGEFFGYGVDGGTGCFVDVEIADEFVDGKRNFPRLLKAFEESGYRPLVHMFRDEPAIAVFSSGPGDGVYASYWGLDARDEPVCLVTDFGVLTTSASATLRFCESGGPSPGRLCHPVLTRADLEITLTTVTPQELVLELHGAVDSLAAVELFAGQGEQATRVPVSSMTTTDGRTMTRRLRPEAAVDAIEIRLTLGATLASAEEEPEPPRAKSPVLRRRPS